VLGPASLSCSSRSDTELVSTHAKHDGGADDTGGTRDAAAGLDAATTGDAAAGGDSSGGIGGNVGASCGALIGCDPDLECYADGKGICWVGTSGIFTMPLDGGAPRMVVQAQASSVMTVVGTSLYWTDSSNIYKGQL
jgi:hypothetical protein